MLRSAFGKPALVLLFLFGSIVSAAQIAYVDINVVGGANDGTTWANAYNNLDYALGQVAPGTEIWVAQGTYVPTVTFDIPANVQLYGGFNGTETTIDQRNLQAFPTILSGDFGDNDIISTQFPSLAFGNRGDNRDRVVSFNTVGTLSVMDGFVIRGGGSDTPGSGGAMAIQYSSPTLRNIRFEENNGTIGGAVVIFSDNGISASNATFLNCVFTNNIASSNGGAIYITSTETTATTTIVNSTFSKNIAVNGGGVYQTQSTGTVVTNLRNSIFFDNIGSTEGLSLFNQDAPTVTVNFQNSLFEELNSAGFGGTQASSNINDLGGNIFNQNPAFVNPGLENFTLQTGSPAIEAGSGALIPLDTDDVDNDANISEVYPFDINGLDRVQLTIVDMGAHENVPVPPVITSATWQDADQDGNIDAVVLAFDQTVDILDPGTNSDGFDAIQINDGGPVTINNIDFTAIGVTSMSINFSSDPITGTDIGGITLTYSDAGSSSIVLTGSSFEMVDSSTPISDIDAAAPILLNATTEDTDLNGRLDLITALFSEDLDGPSVTDGSPEFTLGGGYTISGTSLNGTNAIDLTLTEMGSPDTDQTPVINLLVSTLQDLAGVSNVSQSPTTMDGAAPVLVSSTPSDEATNVPILDDFTLEFSEPVLQGSGNIQIVDTGDATGNETISLPSGAITGYGTTTININPVSVLEPLETYAIQIANTVFQDGNSNAYAGIADLVTLNFTSGPTPNYALDFDGVDEYVNTPFNLNTVGDFTLEAWINSSSLSSSNDVIIGGDDSWWFGVLAGAGGVLRWSFGSNLDGSTDVTDDTWHHVAVTYNNSSGLSTIYLDGVIEAGPTVMTGAASADVLIGSILSPTFTFEGAIDEVRIWNTERSQSQINAFKDVELNSANPGLVAYFDFSDGPNTSTVSDLKGGGPGLLNNFEIADDWIASGHGISAAGPLDSTNPTAAITSLESDPTASSTIPITITWVEEVVGFDLSDISVINGTAGNLNTADNIVFTADITPSISGQVFVDVFSSVATDLTGNFNDQAPQFTIVYDVDPPHIVATTLSADRTRIFVEFDNNVFGAADGITPVDVNDFNVSVVNAGTATVTKNSLTVISPSEIELNVTINNTPDGTEVYEVVPVASSVFDEVGNIMSVSQTANRIGLVNNSVLSFDGNDDYVSVPTDAAFEVQNYTLEAWINIPDQPQGSDSYTLISKGTLNTDGGLNRNGYSLLYGDMGGGLAIILGHHNGVDATEIVQHLVTLSVDTWYHIAATYDGTTMRVYLDGFEVNSNSSLANNTVDYAGDNLDLKIGAFEGSSFTDNHRGLLDEVRIWDYARDPSDILVFKDEELSGIQTGLVAYYDFSDATGSTVTEKVSSRDGFINNADFIGATGNWASGGPLLSPPDLTAPIVTFTEDTQTINSSIISGTVDDLSANIEVSLDGGTTRTEGNNYGDTSWDFDLASDPNFVGDGLYSVIVYATDATENEGTTSGNVTLDLQYSLSFDGTDDYAEIADASSLDITGALTVETWVRFNESIPAEDVPIVAKWNDSGNQRSYVLQLNSSSEILFGVSATGSSSVLGTDISVVTVPFTFATGRWYHIAGVFTPSTSMEIYVNGERVGEELSNMVGSIHSGTSPLTLRNFGNSLTPSGGALELDETRIWSTNLDQATIQSQLSMELTGLETNLEAYYDFNTATGSVVSDLTTNANNGNLLNDVGNTPPADGVIDGPLWQESTIFDTDVVAPFFVTGYPFIDAISASGFDITVQLNEPGTYYYVVVPNAATTPSVDDVRSGTGFGGTGQLDAGNIVVSNANTDFTLSATGLTQGDYDVYIVAQDDEGSPNVQFTNTLIDVTASDPFITTWVTSDGQINIPTTGGGYNYSVTWNNLTNPGTLEGSTSGETGDYLISPIENGSTYEVIINGDFPRIYFNNGAEKDKIQTIEQWGDIAWTNFQSAFYGCTNLTYNAADAPDLSGVNVLGSMFRDATSFNAADLTGWDVSTVTNIGFIFDGATAFNGDVSNWDVSNVSTFTEAFRDLPGFTGDLSGWVTTSATNMSGMFQGASLFDSDVSGWDLNGVTNTSFMFFNASSFNQDLSLWDVTTITAMNNMLSNTATSVANYDAILNGWAAQSASLQVGVTLGATGLVYSPNGAAARTTLTTAPSSWTISGDEISTTVTNTNDTGVGSLRDAIIYANATPGSTISFNIPGGGPWTINLASALPQITANNTVIDGTTQPGWTFGDANGMVTINGSNLGINGINIDAAGAEVYGLILTNFNGSVSNGHIYLASDLADNAVIGGVNAGNIIHGSAGSNGIYIVDGDNATIQGNRIGTLNGTTASSGGDHGIATTGEVNTLTIGGDFYTGEGNLISGASASRYGMNLFGSGGGSGLTNVTIRGNKIGTNDGANGSIPNTFGGINILGTVAGVNIGGSSPSELNIISGNGSHGIQIQAGNTININGNYIGLQGDGSTGLSNNGAGIRINSASPTNINIGDQQFNYISNNVTYGVFFDGNNSSNTAFGSNIFSCNQTAGIGYGSGPLTVQPVIQSISPTQITVSSPAEGSSVTVWIATDGCNDDQGLSQLATGTISGGIATISSVFTVGQYYTATVEDLNGTSEFSAPVQADYIEVTNTNDSGAGSLRDAITAANLTPGSAIYFNIPSGGPWPISLSTTLPAITAAGTIIDASSQIGWNMDSDIMVELLGDGLVGSENGLDIQANNCEIYGLKIAGFPGVGILGGSNINGVTVGAIGRGNVISSNGSDGIRTTGGWTISHNRIGTIANGTAGDGNGRDAIRLSSIGSSQITNNLLSGNAGDGVWVNANGGHTIANNYIGTDESGSFGIPNDNGLSLNTSSNNTIVDNLISGNSNYAFTNISGSNSNDIFRNYVGTDATGTSGIPNGAGGFSFIGDNNTIGRGTPSGQGNIIAFNNGPAIEFGATRTGNTFIGNEIFSNASGIILNGGNNGINAPSIDLVTATDVSGSGINGDWVHLYYDDGSGQGQSLIDSALVAGGVWSIGSLSFTGGEELVVTATNGNGTSEFSSTSSYVYPYPVAEGAGEALYFDGVDDYVELTDADYGSFSELSVEAWIRPDDLPNGPTNEYATIVGKGSYSVAGSTTFGLYFYGTDAVPASYLRARLDNGSSVVEVSYDASGIITGEWMHVAMTWSDGSPLLLYVNGVQVDASTALSGPLHIASGNTRIGSSTSGSETFFEGAIDEVRIWDIQRTESAIRQTMAQKVLATEVDLVAYYRMDDSGDGANLLSIDNSLNGLIFGGAVYETSGAHLGDESTHEYTYTAGSSRSFFNFDVVDLGTANLPLHIYRINQTPSDNIASGFNTIDDVEYYGVFAPGQTYTARLNYPGVTSDRRLLARYDATDVWSSASGPLGTDLQDQQIFSPNNVDYSQYVSAIETTPYPSEPDAGNALSFNGSSDNVNIPDANNLSFGNGSTDEPFTIEAWVNFNSLNTYQSIVSKRGSGVNREYRLAITSLNEIEVLFYDENNSGQLEAQTAALTIGTNEWHHIAFTYDGSSTGAGITIYLDGVSLSTTPSNITYTSMSNTTSALELGIDAGLIPLDGQLDEVRIWNTDLSAADLRDHMIGRIDPDVAHFGNLVAAYKFDSPETGTAYDVAGFHDGTINGAIKVVSGAPQGQGSLHSFTPGPGKLSTAGFGEDVIVNFDDGTGGVHAYLIGAAPDQTVADGFNTLDQTKYYGLFAPGNPKVDIRMDYNNGGAPDLNRRILYRDDATDNAASGGWERLSGLINSDVATDSIYAFNVKSGQVTTATLNPASTYPLLPAINPGDALNFSGGNEEVLVDEDFSFVQNSGVFTIEFWMRADDLTNDLGIMSTASASLDNGFMIALNNAGAGSLRFASFRGASGQFVYDGNTGTGFISDNDWHHVAIVSDGSAVTLYLDGDSGTDLGGSYGPLATGPATNNISLGGYAAFAGSSFNGDLDEIRIWNAALAPGDITSFANTTDLSTHPNYPDMVAYYKFDDGTNSTVLEDVFANNDGTLTGMDPATDWVASGALADAIPSNSLSFDGVDDHIDLGNPPELSITGEMAIEAWINVAALGSSGQTIVSKADPGETQADNIQYLFRVTPSGYLWFTYEYGAGVNVLTTSDYKIPVGTWTHVAVSRSISAPNVTIDLYIDGMLVGTQTIPHEPTGGTNALPFIGRNNQTNEFYFNGEMDEVRIWNTPRNAGQIQSNMHSELVGNESGLVAYYNFNQGVPEGVNSGETTLTDLTINALDGTVTNFDLTGTSSNWVSSGALELTPGRPQDLALTKVSDTQIDLTWTDLSFNETDFAIFRSDGNDQSFVEIGTVGGADITTYSDNTVSAENRYYYYVVARNGDGDSPASEVRFGNTLTPPGAALDFDGLDDELIVADNNDFHFGTNDFAIEFWMYSNDPTGTKSIIIQNDAAFTAGEVSFRVAANWGFSAIQLMTDNGAGGTYSDVIRSNTNSIQTGQWHHVAVTRLSGTTSIYIDGVDETFGGGTVAADIPNSNQPIGIGSLPASSEYFDVTLDELRVFNGAGLTETEVNDWMTQDNLEAHPKVANLVAHYGFNEGIPDGNNTTLGNTIYDLAGNNNGTMANFGKNNTGTNWVTSGANITVPAPPNNALNFDGDDFVSFPRQSFSNGLTYEAWIRTSSSASTTAYNGNPAMTVIGDNDNSIEGAFGIHDGYVRYTHWTGSGVIFDQIDGTIQVNDDQWHHIAVTHDDASQEVRLYVDGVLDVTTTTTIYSATVSANRVSGSYVDGTGTSEFFQGDIDEVRIWNTVIGDADIRDYLYADDLTSHPSNGNLVLHYNMNQGMADGDNTGEISVADQTSNGFDGDFNNFTLSGTTSNFIASGAFDHTPTAPVLQASNLIVFGVGETDANLTWTNGDGQRRVVVVAEGTGNSFPSPPDGTYGYADDYGVGDNLDGNWYVVYNGYGGAASINGLTGGTEYEVAVLEVNGPAFNDTYNISTAMNNPVSFTTNAGAANYALQFDNTDNLNLGTTPITGTGAFTIEAWFNTVSATSQVIYTTRYSGGFTGIYYLGLTNTGQLQFAIGDGTAGNSLYSVADGYNDGEWHHVAAVRETDGTMNLYVDGDFDNTRAQTLHSMNAFPLTVGRNVRDGGANFIGALDELALWTTALTAGEISTYQYQEIDPGHPQYGSLVRYYQLNEATGTTASDATGNGPSPTFNGALDWIPSGSLLAPMSVDNYALDFDGIDDYVALPSGSFQLASDMSVEAWIYLNAYPGDAAAIISRGNDGETQSDNILFSLVVMNDGTLRSTFEHGSGINVNSFSTGAVPLEQWTHVAFTRTENGGQMDYNFYIDGAFDSQTSALAIPDGGDNPTLTSLVGANDQPGTFPFHFNGVIDEVRIWDAELSGTDIASRFAQELVGDEPNLVAYYDFSDGTGSTLVADLSGNGNDGVLTNMDENSDWVEGPTIAPAVLPTLDFALDFDGVNDHLVAAHVTELDISSGTLEAWINPTTLSLDGASIRRIIAKPSGSGNESSPFQMVITDSGELGLYLGDGATSELILSNPGIVNTSTWQHVAVAWDGGNVDFYVDGIHDSGTAQTVSINTNTASLIIGGFTGISGFGQFEGSIDEVRIWDYARNGTDIDNSRNNYLSGTEPGLVAYYAMEDGDGSTVATDSSPTGNDALLTNMDENTDWISGPGILPTDPSLNFAEDFEVGLTGTADPYFLLESTGIWLTQGVLSAASIDPALAFGGTGDAAYMNTGAGNYLVTPPLENANDISFQYRADPVSVGTFDFEVYASSDGGTTWDIFLGAGSTDGTNYEEFTHTFGSPYTGPIQIATTAGGTENGVIDDFTSDGDNQRADLTITSLPVGAQTVAPGQTDVLVYKMQVDVATIDVASEGFFVTPLGGFDPADIASGGVNIYQNIGTDDFGTATLLGNTSLASGDPILPDGSLGLLFTELYNVGSTIYYYVTVDIDPAATEGNSFYIEAPGADSNFGFVNANLFDGGLSDSDLITISGFPGTALQFDGTNDQVVLTNPVMETWSDFTIEMWVNIPSGSSSQFNFFEQVDDLGGGTPQVIIAGTFGGSPYIFIRETNSGINGSLSGSTNIADDQWHHIAYVKNGSQLSAYIDGVLDNTTGTSLAADINFPVSNVSARLGGNAALDEVKFWSFAKTDFSDRLTPLTGGETDLFGYYPLDEATGTIAGDLSSFTNTGTLTNFDFVTGSEWIVSGPFPPVIIPDVTITTIPLADADVTIGDADVLIYKYQMDVSGGDITLQGAGFELAGTATGADFVSDGFDLLYNVGTDDIGTATNIGSSTYGDQPSGIGYSLNQTIPDGSTAYFYLIADINAGGTIGNTFSITLTSPAEDNFGIIDPKNKIDGGLVDGNIFTLQDIPDVTAPSVVNVTPSLPILADGDTQWEITIEFDEPMDTGVDPVISFPVEDPVATLTYNSGVWDDNLNFRAIFDATDANQTLADIDVRVENGQDVATNVMTAHDEVDFLDIDTENPVVTVDALSTNVASPELTGTVDDIAAVVNVTVDGTGPYLANNNGDGTWTLPAGTITPDLTDGVFEVDVEASDAVGNMGTDATNNELTVDVISPVVSVDALTINNASPELTGTIDDNAATIDVTVDGTGPYTATNNTDGTWTLVAGTITPALTDGVYEVDVVATDLAGNTGTDATNNELTIDLTAPIVTIDDIATSITSPELTGTVDDPNATLVLDVDGGSYAPLNNADGTWTLAAGLISPDLADGTYEVSVTATDVLGNVSSDASSNELTISQTILARTAINVSSTGFTARWSTGLDVQTYQLDISETADFSTFVSGWENFETTATSVLVTNLDFSTNYFYRVRLVNTSSQVSDNSNTAIVKTAFDLTTEADSLALRQIFSAIDPQGLNWETARMRDWDGVTLDLNRTRVEVVNISGTNAAGEMPNPFTGNALTNGGLSNMVEMNISDNEITGLMDFSGTSVSSINVQGNSLTFDDLEPLTGLGLATFQYSNQASIQFDPETNPDYLKETNRLGTIRIAPRTTPYALSIITGGTANQYSWFKDGASFTSNDDYIIAGANATIISLDYATMGEFSATVTNTLLPDLTLSVDAEFVLAVAPLSISVKNANANFLNDEVAAYLLDAVVRQGVPGYDTLEQAENIIADEDGYTFENVVLGDYLISIDPTDKELYIPTYFGDAFEWENAQEYEFRQAVSLEIVITGNPDDLDPNLGDGTLFVIIEEDFGDSNGRIDARRRASGRKCGLKKRRSGGRTDQDEFELIAYGETDENGEFEFGFLPEGVYRFFVEYPGIPLDASSFVEFEVGEQGVSDTDFKLSAFVTEGGVEVTIERVLGVILEYFKDLEIYPNPTTEYINIRYRHLKSKDVTAQLIDLQGNTKWSQDLQNGFDGQLSIDVTDMAAGLYILRIYDRNSRNENVVSYRVVIRK